MTRSKAMMLIVSIGTALLVVVGVAIFAVIQMQKSDAGSRETTAITQPGSEETKNEQHQLDVAATDAISQVDRSDRDAVALLAAEILSTWDPSVDQSESSAVVRVKDLIDPKVVELNSHVARPADSALWMEMSEAKAVTKPFVEIQDDEHGVVERPNPDALTVLSTWDWLGPKTRTTNPDTRMFFMQMQKNDAGQWEIGDYSYSDVPTRYLVGTLE